jgi:hypothetical protein
MLFHPMFLQTQEAFRLTEFRINGPVTQSIMTFMQEFTLYKCTRMILL